MFRYFVVDNTNLVSNYSNLNCKVNLTCPGEIITIKTVFNMVYLKQYQLEIIPTKNNYNYNNFYNNSKYKVKELLALTDPAKICSDLKVYMQQGSNNTSYNILEGEGSTITGEPSGSIIGKKKVFGEYRWFYSG